MSNAEAYLAKRPSRVDCPVHGIRTDLFQEIQAKSSGKNLPLLAALCRDQSLIQPEENASGCCCNAVTPPSALKRLSYSHPASSSTPDLYQPGTVVRPVSWHEPTNLDHAKLQVFRGSIHIDDQKQAAGWTDSANVTSWMKHPSTQGTNHNGIPQGGGIVPFNGALHQSIESLDYPTMLTYTTTASSPVDGYHLPPRLHSGGLSGAQSVDNLLGGHHNPHYLGLGIAT